MSELSWFCPLFSIKNERPDRSRRVGIGAACIASIREYAGSIRLVPLGGEMAND